MWQRGDLVSLQLNGQPYGHKPPLLGLSSLPTARAASHFVPDRELADGERLLLEGPTHRHTLRVIHTPGHAANHLCLVLEEDGLLFSGDHVLNGSTTVIDPPDGHMSDYLSSLDRLEAACVADRVEFILPAHGYVLGNVHGDAHDAEDVIRRLRAHRLKREAKIDIVHVPYRGSSQAGIDLLGGQLQMMFDSAPTAIANVRTGRAFAIAVASKTRLPELPDVPTMAEAGFPTIESEAWTGIVAPLRTPPAVIARIHAASVRALNDPVLLDRLKQIGGRPFTGSPEDFGAFIRNEVTRFSVIVKEADIKPE
jgi:glyoxylase-like metal-dependent hydrolase (beta-lactamase superfamily II)